MSLLCSAAKTHTEDASTPCFTRVLLPVTLKINHSSH